MDKLTWFKFTPSNWMMGKVLKCPEITQARFLKLVCLYWNKECSLSYDDAEIEVDKEHLDIMISKKIIKLVDDYIVIDFLNEQLEGIAETSEKRRKAVNERWAKVKQNDTSVLQVNTSVLQNDTDKSKIREDKSKIREDNIKKENSIVERKLKFASTLEPFLNIYGKEFLNDFYKYWTEPNKSNSKFKQELEKTWSLERRLETWAKNDKNFKIQKNGQQKSDQPIARNR